MKRTLKITLAAGAGLGLTLGAVACAVNGSEDASVGESKEALQAGGGFFGSDTLFDFITQSLCDLEGCPGSLHYLGTGSGNGEAAMRGAAAKCGDAGPCQSIAPMSRHLNLIANPDGGTGSCAAGEVQHRIGLDGIGIWKKSTQSLTNITHQQVHDIFCGTNGDGTGGSATWPTGSTNAGGTPTIYRRDDASGTTDTFKTLAPCTAFRSSVIIVTDAPGGAILKNSSGTTLSFPSGVSCTNVTASDCLGLLVANDVNAIGYAGLSAGKVSPAPIALTVDSLAPTETNIRHLIGGGTPYFYSRFLYLNENTLNTRDPAESNFINDSLNDPTGSDIFEQDLVNAGFISCTDRALGTPLNCGLSTCGSN